ncbi:hypothetical protein RJT34_24453 [Clitoria ternatea]|uniref:Rab-GAP TBC domain-containing protein n=1 Tax=Clitoria ternatea TaxID=43366 RepID=A0AAN9FMW8_CLITE
MEGAIATTGSRIRNNWQCYLQAAYLFQQLMSSVTQLPILAVPDFGKPFVVETDASSKGLGAVLLQEGKPLAFWSQALTERGQNKSVYERELMAVVQAVQKWRHYLMGTHFIIVTDQKSLKFLTEQRLLTEEQFKWVSKLIGYDFEIKYRPGKENTAADALSRKPMFLTMTVLKFNEWENWDIEVQKDSRLQAIMQELLVDPNTNVGYSMRGGKLYYKGKLVLPKHFSRIPAIMNELHSSPTGGHSGYFRTFKRVAGVLYWEGMRKDIKEFVMQWSKPKNWPEWLSWAEFWFNTNYSASTKMSPFKALYGQDPPLLLKGTTIPSKIEQVNQLQEQRDEILKELRNNLCKAQDQNRLQANKHRRDVVFQEEEDERSDKWGSFLEQVTKSSQATYSENEHKDTLKDELVSNKVKERNPHRLSNGDDSSNRTFSEGTEVEETATARVSEGDDSSDRKFVSDNTTGNNSGKQQHHSEERNTRMVQRWADIRPSLAVIEEMLSSRIKKRKKMNSEEISANDDHHPSIEIYTNETLGDGINGSRAENASEDQELFSQWKELETLVQGGVPKDLRGEVWQAFIGVKTRRVERYYEDLLAQETNSGESEEQGVPSAAFGKWKKQIEKDIPRTFPGHPALDENGRNSLRRLLLAYARHNPSVGYCQAMNFFAGLLLLLMPEENAFWTFVGLIDEYFEGCYTEQMIESQVDQLVFEELMHERFPRLVNHLDYLGVEVAWISGPWFLSIFVNIIPWDSVLRVWDVLLFEGNRVMLFRTALALMELYGPALVTTKDAGDAITLLQSLTGSTFDSSQLVFTACMGYLAVTEAKLKELREKHRPSVLGVIEERSRKGRVWKDSKLASKLYSFKHDRGSLVEERKNAGGSDTLADKNAQSESHSSELDELLNSLNVDSELNSLPNLEDQVVWLKVELCRLLEEKRSAVLRAEELETALMEMVKEDNRLQLNARVEQLEQLVAELKQALHEKKEEEAAMLQVLIRLEQDQKITEDARRRAEQDLAAHKYEVHLLQEKYEKATQSIAEMEKRVVMAESMLEATLQYESGQSKAISSPRAGRGQSPRSENPSRKVGLLSFGLGWRDRNKGKPNAEESSEGLHDNGSPRKESSNHEHDR